jgi:Integrase core domain
MAGGRSCGLGVTAHPTAEWLANQLTEACGWEQIPRYLIRDRDRAYGEIFVGRVRSIGIRDRPASFRSPWQNGYAERLIGSIWRECIDHVVVFGERHLRHVLLSYKDYYNAARTHLSLHKDAPIRRGVEWTGNVVCRPILRTAPSIRPDVIYGSHRLRNCSRDGWRGPTSSRDSLSIKFDRIAQRKTPPSPVEFFLCPTKVEDVLGNVDKGSIYVSAARPDLHVFGSSANRNEARGSRHSGMRASVGAG